MCILEVQKIIQGQNSLALSAACLNAKKAYFRGWLTALSGSLSTSCW